MYQSCLEGQLQPPRAEDSRHQRGDTEKLRERLWARAQGAAWDDTEQCLASSEATLS